ncbi:DNA polymerase IV [Patescibacteria group bacterium]|nr:DNA polymerase IV [Patescibacteria group bacterium]MBU1755337.1 DNA polymerase IV [Patescibacteria group bacterium]
MTWNQDRDYPKAIIHVDGDAFFAACEVAKNPSLRGKPVVTGQDRGIVSAASYEAKRLGIERGIPLRDVHKICPEAIILHSDYETYQLFSRRMYAIVRRYTPFVEEYGIDECFGDITGLKGVHKGSYEDILRRIKQDLQDELDITFSVGLGPNKVLAKLGSNYNKPDGFTAIAKNNTRPYLIEKSVRKIWGIGPNTATFLEMHGMRTAYEFAQKEKWWVMEHVSKPYVAIWEELNGEHVLPLVTDKKDSYQSLQRTRTFIPSRDPLYLRSELSKNIESACQKARRYHVTATGMTLFLKSQDFRYHQVEIRLTKASNVPHELIAIAEQYFNQIYRKGTLYRTTGVTLTGLRGTDQAQLTLFEPVEVAAKASALYDHVDQLSARFGTSTIYLASSHTAIQRRAAAAPPTETRMALPFLGEVS